MIQADPILETIEPLGREEVFVADQRRTVEGPVVIPIDDHDALTRDQGRGKHEDPAELGVVELLGVLHPAQLGDLRRVVQNHGQSRRILGVDLHQRDNPLPIPKRANHIASGGVVLEGSHPVIGGSLEYAGLAERLRDQQWRGSASWDTDGLLTSDKIPQLDHGFLSSVRPNNA